MSAPPTGDPVIACSIGPNETPVYAFVRVQNVNGKKIYMAYDIGDKFVRQILLSQEGHGWVRGHREDAMAALLLARSAR